MFVSSNLRCFIAIAREKSLKKASETLYVTASPISRRIKIFEDEIGYKLFTRKDKDFTLTIKGKELYDKIIPYYIKILELEEYFSRRKKRLNNKNIMIGVENLNHFLLNPPEEKKEEYVNVSFTSSNEDCAIESLFSEEIHALISHRKISESGICSLSLDREPVCYLCSNELNSYDIVMLRKKTIIIPRDCFPDENVKTLHLKLLALCPSTQVIIVDNIDNFLFLICSGHAVALVGESMAAFYKERKYIPNELNYTPDLALPVLETHIYYLNDYKDKIKLALKRIYPEMVL